MTQKYSAIVFDVDGVLVDSEPLHKWAWDQVLTRYGVAIGPGELDQFIGIPCEVMLAYFQEKAGISLPDAAIDDKRDLFDSAMGARLKPVEGAPETVRELHRRGFPLAAASNSPVDRVRDMLTAIGIWDCFSAAAGIDEVDRGKPEPDVYLLACERLGVAPGRCLAVEDSPTGVRAACAAGLTVWGYVYDFSEEALREAGAVAVIHSLSEVPAV
mgnify:CR=1 FL=1